MATPDDTQLRGLINSNLPDSPPSRPRRIKAAILRATLFAALDYVKAAINGNLTTYLRTADKQPGGANTDSVYRTGKTVFGRDYSNGTGAALEAGSAWIDTLNGNQVSPYFTITSSTDGLAATRYFAIGELPAGTGGTYDFAQIEFVGKPWDNGSGSAIELSIYLANRGGLRYQYTSRGDANSTGIIAQQMPDGRTVIYMASNNDFKAISARFVNSAQAVIYGTPSYNSGLLGTEVFNSMKPSVYRPIQALRYRFPSFTVSNGDGGFPPAPITEAGSAQLSLGANYVGGSSDLALINSNTAGGGISFWQQTGAAAKQFLGWFTGGGNLVIGGTGATAPLERLHLIGNMFLQGILRFAATIANRKITLYDVYNNEHQFFGFGINPNTLRYQISSQGDAHIFFAGTSSATSVELARIQGSGRVGLNISSPLYALDVTANAATGCADGVLARFENLQSLGALLQLHQDGVAVWRVGQPIGQDAFVFVGWGNGSLPERARITADGRFLIGQTGANDRDLLQVNGSISGKVAKQAGDAQPSELLVDTWRVVHNTTKNEVRLVVNVGGAIRSILFA